MRKKTAFTLVELVVVILLLGILAGVAAPKLLGVSGQANENALRHTLGVVREAIDLTAAANGGILPGADGSEAGFKADLANHLRDFPENPLKGSTVVDVQTSGAPLSHAGGSAGWRYDNQSGEFIINSNGRTSTGERYWEL